MEININVTKGIAEKMDDCKIPRPNKYSIFSRMGDCYSFSDKTDILLQWKDGRNLSGKINRLPLKNRIPKIALPEK